jgi:hypothetical protein
VTRQRAATIRRFNPAALFTSLFNVINSSDLAGLDGELLPGTEIDRSIEGEDHSVFNILVIGG